MKIFKSSVNCVFLVLLSISVIKIVSIEPMTIFAIVTTFISLSFSIQSAFWGNDYTDQISEVQNTLNAAAYTLNNLQLEIRASFSKVHDHLDVVSSFTTYWQEKSLLNQQIDDIFKLSAHDPLDDYRSNLIVNNLVGIHDDGIKRRVQLLHDTMFNDNGGRLFSFIVQQIQAQNTVGESSANSKLFDLFVGLLASEVSARCALGYQFKILKRVRPDLAYIESEQIQKSSSRINTLKLKFKQAISDSSRNIARQQPNPSTLGVTYDQIYMPPLDVRHHFSILPVYADAHSGYVICGMQYVLRNDIIYMQIKQGKLLAGGKIDPNSVYWKPVITHGTDQSIQTSDNLKIFTSDVVAPTDYINKYVLTGVQFKQDYDNNAVVLEAQFAKIDFNKGQILHIASYWKSSQQAVNNDFAGSQPSGYYDVSGFGRKVIQHIDLQPLNSDVVLTAVGMHLNVAKNGYGHLTPRLVTFNYADIIQV